MMSQLPSITDASSRDGSLSADTVTIDSLVVVTCGGTIAMATNLVGLRVPASSQAVAALVAEIAGVTTHVVEAGEIDSSQATPADWATILYHVHRARIMYPSAAIIVTHGTDSLAWSAGALAVTGPWAVPVVFTAANIPLGDPGSDAEANLRSAITAALSVEPGVYVAFAGEPGSDGVIFQAGFVRKARAGGQAFAAVPAPYGFTHANQFTPANALRTVEVPAIAPGSHFETSVVVLACQPALDVGFYKAAFAVSPPTAVVVELYACATISSAIVALLAELVTAGVSVLACATSPIEPGDAAYPSTVELTDAGVQVFLSATIELLVPAACAST